MLIAQCRVSNPLVRNGHLGFRAVRLEAHRYALDRSKTAFQPPRIRQSMRPLDDLELPDDLPSGIRLRRCSTTSSSRP
jgi:hypothetical protein